MTVAALRASASSFGEAGAELHTLLGSRALPSHDTRARAAQLGSDALGVFAMIADLHEDVVAEWRAREQSGSRLLLLTSLGGSLTDESAGRFIVLVKASFLFVRAYHDAMYALLFEIVKGRPTHNRRMQEAAAKPTNPVGRVLREQLSGYFDWFAEWRALRNEVKEGVNFSLLGPPDDIAVTFTSTTNSGGYVLFDVGRPVVRLSHLASALTVSAALTRLASSLARAEDGLRVE
jgi:hypothetical protein